MLETMYAAPGVGLAAPQIGVSLRVIVFDAGEGPCHVLNPVIEEISGEYLYEEGCLSVPDRYWEISRPSFARVRGLDLDGNEVTYGGDLLLGRVLQHEVDHLDGFLLLKRLGRRARKQALRDLRIESMERAPVDRVAFLGTPGEAVPILLGVADVAEIALVITRPDAAKGRSGRLVAPPVKVIAAERSWRIEQPKRAADIAALIEGIDVAVVAAYGRIIPGSVLEMPRAGFINIHFSILRVGAGRVPSCGQSWRETARRG